MNQSKECIFCQIVNGKIPAPKLYEDEDFICIRDLQPQSKTHLLVIPKVHVASLETAFPEGEKGHSELIGNLFKKATSIARAQGLLPSGFRSVINTNSNGGQTVYHIHLHLLGGEPLKGEFGS